MTETNNKVILLLYAKSQTYTATVFEHVKSFQEYSKFAWLYLDFEDFNKNPSVARLVDAVVVHYSVRLPFRQLEEKALEVLSAFNGVKVLFIQDEYDGIRITRETIERVCFNLVFSTVPEKSIERFYPPANFPKTKFLTNLTGYVGDDLVAFPFVLPSKKERPITVGYRGRSLPITYGSLGKEKSEIGHQFKRFCEMYNISNDIRVDEKSRIYGEDWYRFIASCSAMLGTESGSNILDVDGELEQKIKS